MDQEKEANPIAEIFDEVFTLMEDLETRSVAVLEYMKEQGGVSDEKLAPYLDRAAAASDVRWRAARARMEHLLAPKPKSATEVGNDQKAKGASESQSQGKEVESGKSKTQGDKEQRRSNADSKEPGKELASAPSGSQSSAESKDEKSQNAKPATDAGLEKRNAGDGEQSKEAKATSKGAELQAAAAFGGEKKSEVEKSEGGKQQPARSDGINSAKQSSGDEKPQTEKAAN
jgi:hypothetical protein